MSTRTGALLWNRKRPTLIPGDTEIDTGLTQLSQAFGADPDLESRVQVVPLAPTAAWSLITHDEPVLDPVTNTVHVTFHNGDCSSHEINVLFWNPHTLVGPGQADTYTP